jgi:hypothetical protein
MKLLPSRPCAVWRRRDLRNPRRATSLVAVFSVPRPRQSGHSALLSGWVREHQREGHFCTMRQGHRVGLTNMPMESVELSEFFKSVKKPKYVLGTTYTLSLAFFESVVFPHIDRSRLKSCVLICDDVGYRRSLSESPALQGAAQSYLVVPAPWPGCFHPKVWVLVSESEVGVLCGSGNLTQSGFIGNAELFDTISFSLDAPPNEALLDDLVTFVEGLSQMWQTGDRERLLAVEILGDLRDALSIFRRQGENGVQPTQRFLHSFAGRLIDLLPVVPSCRALYVASPFFGGSTEGIGLLVNRYGGGDLHLFPAVHDGGKTDLPLAEVESSLSPTTLSPICLPTEKSEFAHLKLYGIDSGRDENWLFCTSANCTRAAWGGENVEAGVLRQVDASVLQDYFVPGTEQLPDGEVGYTSDPSSVGHLAIHAVDSGGGLDIQVMEGSKGLLPLADAMLTIRTGSHIVSCRREALFESGPDTRLLWEAFEGWSRRKHMAVCLELTATTSHGEKVLGRCFVENRVLLTADPLHRSAWRGALALLDAEGMPDLSDIAAIFTLVGTIFSGELSARTISIRDDGPVTKQTEEDSTVHVAIWPPQPDVSGLHRHLSTTGLGQLQWCQRILETLLRPGSHASSDGRDQDVLKLDDGVDGADDPQESQEGREENVLQKQKLSSRVWKRAWSDYCQLKGRLQGLVPTQEIAANIWPASVFVFLATAAVYRAVRRESGDLNLGTSLAHMCDSFLDLMLNPRKQPGDFCVPWGFRYRSKEFPSLVRDLRRTFGLALDEDLAAVMLTLMVSFRMRRDCLAYPKTGLLRLREFMTDDTPLDAAVRETCHRIWRQYLTENGSAGEDDLFLRAFDKLAEDRGRHPQ